MGSIYRATPRWPSSGPIPSAVVQASQRLLALVCGFEHGGTTAVSELLRRHPEVDAGFEGGFLLADTPAGFPDIEPHFGIALRGWGLSARDMDHICAAGGFGELYDRLADRYVGSQAGERIFDKTPRYMAHLADVMDKVPETPVVAIVRDPRALFWSWRKRADRVDDDWIDRFAARYRRYAESLRDAEDSPRGSRIHVVRHEDLSSAPSETAPAVHEALGLTWDDAFLEFDPRYRNVRGDGLVPGFVAEYRDHLTDDEQQRILEATADFADWRWEPPPGFVAQPPPPRVERTRPGVTVLRDDDARRRARRAAAVGSGGPEAFRSALEGRLASHEVVLDLGWPRAGAWRWVRDTRERGYLRRVDWEGTAILAEDGSVVERVGGRFDAVIAHSVLPHLDEANMARFFADVAALLSPGGRMLATGFVVDEEARSEVVVRPHGKSRPDRPPRHFGRAQYEAAAEAVGLDLSPPEDIDHPNGQRLLVGVRR